MLDLDTELGHLVKEELRRGWYAQAVNARARQMRIAQANAVLEHAHIEGVGQHVASIDAFAFYDWERRNPGITRSRDWLKSLLRDNPECRVRGTSAKTQVSFAGLDFNPSEPSGICPERLTNVNGDKKVTIVNSPRGTQSGGTGVPPVTTQSTPSPSGLRSPVCAL